MTSSPDEMTALLGSRRAQRGTSKSEDVRVPSPLPSFSPPLQGKTFECDTPTVTSTLDPQCYSTFHTFDDDTVCEQKHYTTPYQPARLDWESVPEHLRHAFIPSNEIATTESRTAAKTIVEPTLEDQASAQLDRNATKFEADTNDQLKTKSSDSGQQPHPPPSNDIGLQDTSSAPTQLQNSSPGMSEKPAAVVASDKSPKEHKPLVVGRTKPKNASMDSSNPEAKAALAKEIKQNVEANTSSTAPVDGAASTKKKEKAPKQPKPPKAVPPTAPLSPALIDLRVGHILRAINHPNADSLYVSTIAMGDAEGTEYTQLDEETGKVVRTVCSGLNGLVPLEEMQGRKVIVVANLKPVNMRSIKSAAMVLAASPAAEEGADPHAADRVVELVSPPEGAEAGDPVYFEGWEYGEGKGPEKVLNPKKKQWEAIQPGFYTSDDLVAGFDASKSEVEGERKGDLIVAGKGKCTVKTLKGAVIR
jgi:tRNA-binding EMAP/Myf-like protein